MNAPIIVAGAGIGGLTAALALAHNGRRALVLEQAPVITWHVSMESYGC